VSADDIALDISIVDLAISHVLLLFSEVISMADATQKSKRILFTFDDTSLNNLEDVKEKGGFNSLGTAVRESIEINQLLHDQADEGFSEVVVRNPKTKQEKTLVIRSLTRRGRATTSS
jgi:hypothetical protein